MLLFSIACRTIVFVMLASLLVSPVLLAISIFSQDFSYLWALKTFTTSVASAVGLMFLAIVHAIFGRDS